MIAWFDDLGSAEIALCLFAALVLASGRIEDGIRGLLERFRARRG